MNSVDGFNSMLDKARYKNIKLKPSSIEIIQSTEYEKNNKQKERCVGHN